jgi:hypothetical protein
MNLVSFFLIAILSATAVGARPYKVSEATSLSFSDDQLICSRGACAECPVNGMRCRLKDGDWMCEPKGMPTECSLFPEVVMVTCKDEDDSKSCSASYSTRADNRYPDGAPKKYKATVLSNRALVYIFLTLTLLQWGMVIVIVSIVWFSRRMRDQYLPVLSSNDLARPIYSPWRLL